MDAAGQVSAGAKVACPTVEAIAVVQGVHCPTPSTDGDCDDLYGDVNLGSGFLPLGPPSPTSPPKTPSPGGSIPSSSSPPPRRTTPPKPQPEPEPQRKPTQRHQPPPLPFLAPKPTPQHQPPRRVSSGGYTSQPTTALYIGELPWWTTDAEVEAALAPHGALHDLHFFADRDNGRALGSCRADFLDPDAAASAAAALQGQAFHGNPCVASLSPPPALHRPDADFHAAPTPRNLTRVRGVNTSDVPSSRGNVEPVLGDRPVLGPLPRPMAPHPRPPPSDGMIGGGVGYGGFPSMGHFNSRVVTGALMKSMAVAPHANPAFLAAHRTAMGGAGFWHGQGMARGLWGGHQPWHFEGLVMPRLQHHQAQQQHGNWGYGQERGMWRERPGSRNEEWEIGNVRGRGYPQRRQFGHDGGGWSREHDLKEKGRYRERVLQNERERARHCDGRDRHGGGDQRRYQECTERRERARSWSHSSDGGDDDHPRRKRC